MFNRIMLADSSCARAQCAFRQLASALSLPCESFLMPNYNVCNNNCLLSVSWHTQVYLGFTARTGGANNIHWVRAIETGDTTTIPQRMLMMPFAPVRRRFSPHNRPL